MKDRQLDKCQPNRMRVIAITGGKGGVGKSTLSVNLSVAFAKAHKKVLLFDADLGLANVDVMLGLKPQKTIHDFLLGKCGLNDICIKGPHGLVVIPACSGIQEMADLSPVESMRLIQSFSCLGENTDTMIIDMASGISDQVMNITHASQDVILVVCNDPASLMDSYAVVKILNQKFARTRFGVVVNKTRSLQEGFDVFSKFQDIAAKFLNVTMHYLGHVPRDDYLNMAARERVSVVDKFPRSPAATAFNDLCHGINHWHDEATVEGGIHFFFEKLIQERLQGV